MSGARTQSEPMREACNHTMDARLIMAGQVALTILLTSAVLAVQLTAFLACFGPLSVTLVFSALVGAAVWVCRRTEPCCTDVERMPQGRLLAWTGFVIGVCVLLVRVAYPLLLWPESSVGASIPYDALAYHFPQAVELWKTGTLWNTGVTCWQYPSGYEGLLALSYLATGRETLFGLLHALLVLHFALTLCALLVRHTRLPAGLLVLVTAMAMLCPPLRWTVFEVGKNDLFLATAVLSVILYAPIVSGKMWMPGLAWSSALALAIKPTAIPVVGLTWACIYYRLIRSGELRGGEGRRFALASLCLGLGCLWVVRNLVLQGALFSGAVMDQAGWTIGRNLFNPFFYAAVPSRDVLLLQVLEGLVALVALLIIRMRTSGHELAVVLVMLLLLFLVTPCSALWNNNIQWRFGMPVFAFLWVAGVAVVEPLIGWLWLGAAGSIWALPVAACLCLLAATFLFRTREHLKAYPDNKRILVEWFACPVGVDGYYGAYDFLRRNVHGQVIASDAGLPYLLYGTDFSNMPDMGASGHRARPNGDPTVYVTFSCDRFDESPLHPRSDTGIIIPDIVYRTEWEVRYADSQGKVYFRKPPEREK